MINVVNKHSHQKTPNDIYVGRGSDLGNPYTHLPNHFTLAKWIVSSREEAIELYKKWLSFRLSEKDSNQRRMLGKLVKKAQNGDVNLVCYCKPNSCHADHIKELIENLLDHDPDPGHR